MGSDNRSRCQFVITVRARGRPATYCEQPARPRSSYCEEHHAVCRRETYEADRYDGERQEFDW